MTTLIANRINEAANLFSVLSNDSEFHENLGNAVMTILKSYAIGGCLYVAGNGGSASDAEHLVAELVGKLGRLRPSIRAHSLSGPSSTITAIGNDYGYEEIFSRQIESLMSEKDIFLGITTSGNSKNIINALIECKNKGITSILLSGDSGGECAKLASYKILIPSANTARIQESHTLVYHIMCEIIENFMYPNK